MWLTGQRNAGAVWRSEHTRSVMPLTLDPLAAFVCIDLQEGIVVGDLAHPLEQVVGNAARLAQGFRDAGLPVVLVNVEALPPGRVERPMRPAGSAIPDTGLVAALGAQASDHRVTKRSPGAFAHTGLEGLLRDVGASQIVLAGIATSVGVESTARAAYDLGFNVAFAVDAISDRTPEAHEGSVGRVFPRIGELATADEILALLRDRAD